MYDPAEEQYGQAIIAVTPDLKYKDHYAPSNAAFMWKRDLDMQVTPVVFNYKGHEYWSRQQRVPHVVDGCERDRRPDHRTPVYRTPSCATRT